MVRNGSIPRPFSVTLLAFGVLIIAGFHLVRAIQALIQWEVIASLLPGLQIYLGLSGLAWALVGLPLAWWLWRGHPRGLRLVRWISLTYALYYWLDRLLLRGGLDPVNLPFAIGLTILSLLFVFWTLSRGRVRKYFQS
jgi:hypothetical protein